MGGCAGKPKDSGVQQEPLPAEGSAPDKKAAAAEGETVALDSSNGGEIQTTTADTVVDPPASAGISDRVHKPEDSAEAGEELAKKTEDKVDAPTVNESKDKVEAGNEIQELAKEGQVEAEADKPDAAPGSEDKIEALLANA
ncbi:uncharacterized protein LOC132165227 [Corylus avellana]|uniref:uncharacterized protein LOC132165227 n=1 Tax=Corylus avellana TaxID=13451 RepID=UPI00286B6F94|nr:uncharacterized protein LOC132165227 [Corylus avellana]